MKAKKRIKKLEATISSMKEFVQKGSLTLTDVNNPNFKVVISLKNGEFKIEKIITEPTAPTETIELILKDNK